MYIVFIKVAKSPKLHKCYFDGIDKAVIQLVEVIKLVGFDNRLESNIKYKIILVIWRNALE